MADYAQEQEMEIEALEAILMDEFKEIHSSESGLNTSGRCFQITLSPQDDEADEPTTMPVQLGLIFSHTEKYPDEPPLLNVKSLRGIPGEDLKILREKLQQEASENLGMAMVYTLVSSSKEWLSERFGEESSLEIAEAQERAKEEVIVPHGEPVTLDTFLAWRERFEAEMALERAKIMPESALTAPKEKRLSGRQWFESGRASGKGAAAVAEESDEEDDEDIDFDEDDFEVSIKWQKELFRDVEIDTSLPPYVFKGQLFELTGVPPERQKIMVKGGILKDDVDWSTVGVKEGQKLMMMGTADEIVKAPEKGPVFIEDLPEDEQVLAVGHSAGLFNLGNTCYMNSTLQCLHSVPELKSALIKYSNAGRSDMDQTSHMLTVATRDLFSELDRSVKAVAPMQFWMVLRKKYPQFGQLQNSTFMQQDAEECWTQLLYTLSQSLRSAGSSEISDAVKDLFGIDLVSRVHCQESGEESSEAESVYSLKCHISHEVNHLIEGLKHGLKSEIEKVSPSLGRSAIFLKESRINSLPRYLTIQFVRFFWKRESNQKAKILRKVDYPLVLDVFDLCSDDLRKQLEAPRLLLRNEEGKKLGLKPNEKTSDSADKDVKMSDAEGTSTGNEAQSSVTPQGDAPSSDKETQMTGIYDLVAVLTHKGRSADSGHYVGWVKQESGKWIEYDDDNPIAQREEDILKLSGGGDWHMAYICMYKARVVPM